MKLPLIIWHDGVDDEHIVLVATNTFINYRIVKKDGDDRVFCWYDTFGRYREFKSVEDAKSWVSEVHYPAKMENLYRTYFLGESNDVVEDIIHWFEKAKPHPTEQDIKTQLGCHFEEVGELLVALQEKSSAIDTIDYLSRLYKSKEVDWDDQEFDGAALCDALCDQIVTALGVGYMMGFDMGGALREVNSSNWSKFEDGEPVLNEYGKIMKGSEYRPPELQPFLFQGGD